MKLTPQDITEFQDAYRRAYGEHITPAQAESMASDLLRLVEWLARPLPDELESAASSAVQCIEKVESVNEHGSVTHEDPDPVLCK